MIYEEDRVDKCASHVLLLTSDPVFKEQIKGIIVRIGEAVKVISHTSKHIQIRDKQYPSVLIGGCENTLSFPSEETSLGSGLPSHLPKGDVPCPSCPSHGFLHHTI